MTDIVFKYVRIFSLGLCLSLSLIAQPSNPSVDPPTTIVDFASAVYFQALAGDSAGNIYAAGMKQREFPGLPACTGLFIAKFAPDGQVSWAACPDASRFDTIAGLALDAVGNVYIAGSTSDRDFPTTLPPAAPGKSEGYWGPSTYGFLTKLDSNGGTLYSVLFGGEAFDVVTGLAVTPQGVVAVSGSTTSQFFPTTPGAAYTRPSFRDENGFAVQFDSIGAIVLSTYLPGFSVAWGSDPDTHYSHPPVLVGWEASGSLLLVGSEAARLSPDGSALSYPFPELPGFTSFSKLAMDDAGNAYVAAAYKGPDSAAASCGANGSLAALDIAIAALAKDTLKPIYSTHLGSVCQSLPTSLDVTPDGTITVTGTAGAFGFPMLNPVLQTMVSGGVFEITTPAGTPAISLQGPTAVTFQLSADGSLRFSTHSGDGTNGAAAAVSTRNGAIYFASNSSIVRIPPQPKVPFTVGIARNAFSGLEEGRIAPGMLLRVDGQNFAEEAIDLGLDHADPLPETLGGIQVMFDGTPAGILSVAADHVICVVPATVSSKTSTAHIQLVKAGEGSTVFTMTTGDQQIGLLTASFPDLAMTTGKLADGELAVFRQPGIILNADGTSNSPDNPATVGSTVTVFATGVGLPVVAGTQVTLQPYPTPFYTKYDLSVLATARPVDGFIAGLAALDLHVPGYVQGSPSVGLQVGGSILTIYVK